MAFNFRPKSKEEILKKKKKYSEVVSEIFQIVLEEYGEGLILDPTTNFEKVKIPRIVGESNKISDVRTFVKSKIGKHDINISFGNGSGTGKGTDAKETQKQENCTRLYCEIYMKNNKFPSSKEVEKIYPEVSDDWYKTFESQSIAIKKWLGNKSGYEFSRDQGIMPIVEGIAIDKCGVRTKDSWNPADIYAVKTSEKSKIISELKSIGDLEMDKSSKLDRLNSYMRDKILSKELVGISLKKLKKGNVQTIELSNATKKKTIEDICIVPGSISLDLDLNQNQEFNTGEMSFSLKVAGNVFSVQIRAFSGGVRESTQMDITGKTAAAKLGKVSSREAIDPYLGKFGLKRRMGSHLPKVGQWNESNIKKYVDEWNSIKNNKISNISINWGESNWEETLRKCVDIEKENDRTASQLSSKLQCFQWVKIFNEIERRGKLKEFLIILYYGAKKEYDSAGPFLKIA